MKNKASKFDFKESNLPSNRKELFFDILKNNFRVLLKVGLVLILFSLPLIILLIFRDFINASFYNSYKDDYVSYMTYNNLIFNSINALAYGILGIGVAGIIKIIKRLCFLDPIFFLDDFKAGIKDNGKHMFFLFFIFGLVQLVNSYTLTNTSNEILAIIPSCISFAIIYPTFIFMIMSLAVYEIKFKECIYTSFMLYIKSAIKTLLIYIVSLIPLVILSFIGNIIAKYGLFIIELLIVIPILLVALFDYCCLVFDEFINKTHYPEIYRKGLVNR